MPNPKAFDVTEKLKSRFFAKVIKTPGNACWKWSGQKAVAGYGFMAFKNAGKVHCVQAHRASYAIHNGPFDFSLFVMHKCDNPECTNPNHLELGTHSDNMRDAINKGRMITDGSRLPPRPIKYPLRTMAVGDFIFVPGVQHHFVSHARWRLKREIGFEFSTEKCERNGAIGILVTRIK